MKRILLLFILSVSAVTLFAQPDSLLKKFRYRINNFRAVGFNINGASQFSQFELVAGTHKNSSASGGLGGFYYNTKSTDKILQTLSTNLYGSFSRAKSDNPANVNTSKNFSSTSRFNILNKWFTKKIFTELGTDISGNYYGNKDVNTNVPATLKNSQTQYSFAINTGIGKGRLENITDMQNALWLYKELTAAQRVSGNLSAGDLDGLGKSITKGNNTRVLDSRKRTQFLLETVDNYLQQKGLVSKTDITYFSNLNDILFFAFNTPRFTGTEKFIRLTPSITGNNNESVQNNSIDKFRHRFNTRSIVLSSGIKKYIPASLIHQNNYGVAVKLSYISTDLTDRFYTNNIVTSEIKGKTDLKQAGVNLFYEHAFYPNTRTIVNINLQSELGYQDVNRQTGFYGTASLAGNFNYFISYRTRFTCSAAVYYQKNTYYIYRYLELLPNNIQLSVNAGLEISL